jgi:hypothetical protein
MSQVISFPAAFHLFCQIDWSPSAYVALIPENSLSNADAVTEICELSLKRLAVSFTTAKLQEECLVASFQIPHRLLF